MRSVRTASRRELDADTPDRHQRYDQGRLWATEHGPIYRNGQGDGPRSTPTIDGARVYVLGANGNLSCLQLRTGRVLWRLNLLTEFSARNIAWGLSESPLVVGGLVLANAGGRGASIVALEKGTGQVVWKAQSDPAGYSSAIVANIAARRQAIFFTAKRALGLDLETGKLIWDYSRVANDTANAASILEPVVTESPNLLEARLLMARALERLGRLDRAVDELMLAAGRARERAERAA